MIMGRIPAFFFLGVGFYGNGIKNYRIGDMNLKLESNLDMKIIPIYFGIIRFLIFRNRRIKE